jgi:ATP-binding protein involved in chromosome partitioning
MTNITQEMIEDELAKITLGNKKSILEANVLDGISHKDGHIQISLYANKSNIEEIEKIGKIIEKKFTTIKGVMSITAVLTNEPIKEEKSKKLSKDKSVNKIEGVKNIIAIASGKGGVGKSTVSTNLASAFSLIGKKVGILDADIHGPSIPHMLGLKGKPELNSKKKIVPFEFRGMKVMSIGFLVDEDQPVVWRGPMVHSAIKQMATDTDWGDLDILIIDMPPGTGDAQITVSQHLPLNGAIIVSTPQPVALNDAIKAIGMFKKVNIDILGIIENMSYLLLADGTKENIFGENGAKEMSKNLNIKFINEIPLDKKIRESSDNGVPFVFTELKGQINEIFTSSAKEIEKILESKL